MVWHDISSFSQDFYSPHPYLKAFFAVGYITLFFDLLVLCYCFYERRYPPLKAKNLPLMGALLLAYFCFWTGLAHSFGVWGWKGLFGLCFTFREYFEYPFGIHLFLFILCYRLLILYRLLVLRRPSSDWYRVSVVLMVYLPLLTGYALFDLFDAAHWFDAQHGLGCVPKLAWSIFSFTVVLSGISALIFLNYSLRNIPPSLAVFHEYKETKQGSLIFLSFYAIISVVYFTGASMRFWGQAVILILVYLMLNYYFWVVLFEPLTGCLFNRERTLQLFYERIGEITGQKSASTQRTMSQYRRSGGLDGAPLSRYSREGSSDFKRTSGQTLAVIGAGGGNSLGSTVYASPLMEATRPTATTISSGEKEFLATSLEEGHLAAVESYDRFPPPPPPLLPPPPPPTIIRHAAPVPTIHYPEGHGRVSFGDVSYLTSGGVSMGGGGGGGGGARRKEESSEEK